MQVHSNAQTTQKGRLAMIGSALSCRALALRYDVSVSTAHRWRNRQGGLDRSSRPKSSRLAMDPVARQTALLLRKQGLTLDECFDALSPVWAFSRASLHRFLVSQGLGHQRVARATSQPFKAYEPGFLHIDCTYLPKMEGQTRFAFVAIDRATRMAFVQLLEKRSRASATGFLVDALAFFPFKIHRVLTDNGCEFTNRFFKRWPDSQFKPHPFELVLTSAGISHRLIRPYTPKTNGMVERFNRLIKDKTLGKRSYQSHRTLESDMLAWTSLYNLHRKHSGINRQTPLQEALRWYKLKPEIFTRDPETLRHFAFSTS